MDARKAFDKVNHWHLFDKLLNRGVPVHVVRMLLYWHTYQDFLVRWNNTLSPSFKVSNGVRQGVILSPRLFSVYIDDLSKALSKVNIGCHLYFWFKYDLGQKYQAPQVRPDWGSNS